VRSFVLLGFREGEEFGALFHVSGDKGRVHDERTQLKASSIRS
jgi:hypothetical protein